MRSTADVPLISVNAARGFFSIGGGAMPRSSTSEAEKPSQPASSLTSVVVESYHASGAAISWIPGHGRVTGSSASRSETPPAMSPR